MKTLRILFATGLAFASTVVSAKTLVVTVSDVRNDKGNILVMAKIAGQEKPVFSMTPAKPGKVELTLENIDADAAEISFFHDEDGDYKMKMGERGPVEGYGSKKCKLKEEHNATTIKLYYPTEENN